MAADTRSTLADILTEHRRSAGTLAELAADLRDAGRDGALADLLERSAAALTGLTTGTENRETVIRALRNAADRANERPAPHSAPGAADDNISTSALRDHLAGRHGAVTSADATAAELADEHEYEHRVPCTIRNHDIDDLAFDPAKAQLAYTEADGAHDEGDPWARRAERIATELVALCAATGAHEGAGAPMNVEVHADDADDNAHNRRFYVDIDELEHGEHGVITGTRRVRYQLHLTRTDIPQAQ